MKLGMDPTYINLPAFSAATLVAVLLANAVLLVCLFVLAGPALIAGRDAFGRPMRTVGVLRRAAMGAALLAVSAYFAAQSVMLYRFWPYYLDPGSRATELVIEKVALPVEDPIVFWIETTNHRFGVTEEIWRQVATGDLIEARFRSADDTLFELQVVESALERLQQASPQP